MEKVILALIVVFIFPVFADAERVKGHWKDTDRDGIKDTYVNPYNRSNRNDTTIDNYNTKGNTNPYTGKEGTIDPYKPNNNTFSNPYSSPNPYSNPYSNPYKGYQYKSPYDRD